MADMEHLFALIDTLSIAERYELQQYLDQRHIIKWWVVPAENIARLAEVLRPLHEETSSMSEDEINAVIDEAIDEVRRERNQNPRHL